jgi:hypothetical protein
MITTRPAILCAALLALAPVSLSLRVESLRTEVVNFAEAGQDAAVHAAEVRSSRRLLMVRFCCEVV